ncbi:DUF6480 family protein [Saccharopolyspora hordei]|uniref:Uncharacterized protein n=1 Tax=Saccharopolyspora hordei TaxID=1838 RepID=A0A853ANW5_9PSEU|nr:DUF6480 family protein [Saccharopolyspora hordei]NYI85656.1 hypothetical protein [Saccharopolyspora hordei]
MSEHTSSPEPDPEPDRTPGLEAGGSVPPGETPPESASATEGLSHTSRASANPTKWVWLVVIAVVVVLVAGFFVFWAIGAVS